MKERVVWGGVAVAIFLPFLIIGNLPFQLFVGVLAMIGVSELLKMKRLEVFSFEGVFAMLAAFVLAVPMDHYLTFLPIDANVAFYSLMVFFILAGTVLNSRAIHLMMRPFRLQLVFMLGLVFNI